MGFNNVDVRVGSAANVINALQDYNTVILKPNIVDNRNVLTQSMMSEKHTKYVIRWNYILEGGTVTVPEDCIVEFAGGTVDDGVIVGNNTRLIYSKPIDEICKAERQGTWIYDTTVADEEDITSVEGHLKFKDRPATDGMGKVILRKNKSFASQVTKPNTIYVIQYDFTLDEDVTIPENCVLEFAGGSISGAYTLTGNNTGIQAGLVKIFNTNVTLAGTWNVAEAYPEWFGAKGDGVTDDTLSIRKTVISFITTRFQNKCYILNTIDFNNICINLPEGHVIVGSTTEFSLVNLEDDIYTLKCTNANATSVLQLSKGCKILNISILGTGGFNNDSSVEYNQVAIKGYGVSDIIIENVKATNFGVGFDLISMVSTIRRCYCYNSKIGFFVHGVGPTINNPTAGITTHYTSTTIENCYCIRIRTYAYIFAGMMYSTMHCLAADGCGMPSGIINNNTEIYPPYLISWSNNITLNTIAAEKCLKLITCFTVAQSVLLNSYILYKENNGCILDSSYTPSPEIYYFNYCNNLSLFYGRIDDSTTNRIIKNTSNKTVRIRTSNNTNILFDVRCSDPIYSVSKNRFDYKDGCSEKIVAFFPDDYYNNKNLSCKEKIVTIAANGSVTIPTEDGYFDPWYPMCFRIQGNASVGWMLCAALGEILNPNNNIFTKISISAPQNTLAITNLTSSEIKVNVKCVLKPQSF